MSGINNKALCEAVDRARAELDKFDEFKIVNQGNRLHRVLLLHLRRTVGALADAVEELGGSHYRVARMSPELANKADIQCRARDAVFGSCDLDRGHHGPHEVTRMNGTKGNWDNNGAKIVG